MNHGVPNQSQLTPCFDLLEGLADVLSNASDHTIEDEIRLGKLIDKLYKLKLNILESRKNFPRYQQNPLRTQSFPALNDALSMYRPQTTIPVKVAGYEEQKPIYEQTPSAAPPNKPVKKDPQIERIKQCIIQLTNLLSKNNIQEIKDPLAECKNIHSTVMNEISNKKTENEIYLKSALVKTSLEECAEKSKQFTKLLKKFNESQNEYNLQMLMDEVQMAAFYLITAVRRCFPETKEKPCAIINKFRLKQCIEKLKKFDLLCIDGNFADLRVSWLQCKDVPSLINSILSLPTFQQAPNENDLEQVREKAREVGKLFTKFNETTNEDDLNTVILEIMVTVPTLITILQKSI